MARSAEVKAQRLPEQVARALGRRVVEIATRGSTERPPTEQEVAEEFGVSRTVARESLSILRSLGLVEIIHGRRLVVRPPSDWDYLNAALLEMLEPAEVHGLLADLHDVRLLVEPWVAARAAQRIEEEALGRLEGLLEMMSRSEADPDTYLGYDVAFHMELLNADHNRILGRVLCSARGLLDATRRVTNALEPHLVAVTEAHRQIYLAVRAGDPQAAYDAMTAHLETVTPVWLESSAGAHLPASAGSGVSTAGLGEH